MPSSHVGLMSDTAKINPVNSSTDTKYLLNKELIATDVLTV